MIRECRAVFSMGPLINVVIQVAELIIGSYASLSSPDEIMYGNLFCSRLDIVDYVCDLGRADMDLILFSINCNELEKV